MSDLALRPHGIGLVVSDVDGTLLTPDKRLTPRTAAAIRRLRGEGIHFALASTRPPFGMTQFVEPLGLTTPLLACAGALAVHPDTGEVLDARPLPGALVLELLDVADAHGLDARLFWADRWAVRSLRDHGVGRELRVLGREPERCADPRALADSGLAKLTLAGPASEIRRAREAIRRDFRGRVTLAHAEGESLDLMHPLVDKGRAVRQLAGLLGLPMTRVAVLGDSEGDLSMFRVAGLAIAMASAPVAVRRAADRTAPSNLADGVAAAIEAWVLPVVPVIGHLVEQGA